MNSEEWDLIHHLIDFLKIFRDAVESFSSEKHATLSNALVFRVEIENTLKVNESDQYLITELKEKMLANLDNRFPISEEMLIATILDPRLHNLARLLEELTKIETSKIDLIEKEIAKIASNVNVEKTVQVSSQHSKTKKTKEQSVLSKLIQKHAYGKSSESNDSQKFKEEINKYFLTTKDVVEEDVEEFDIFIFWKNHSKAFHI